MPQGEYVTVGRLEAIYAANSPSMHQMYLYGNGLRAYLVAVVVPQQGKYTHAVMPLSGLARQLQV